MVASSSWSASTTSAPGCQPRAQTTRAPMDEEAVGEVVDALDGHAARVGMAMPEEALPEAYERCERMTTALGANSMLSRSQLAPL